MDNTVHRYCFGINKLFYKKEKLFLTFILNKKVILCEKNTSCSFSAIFMKTKITFT